MPPRFLALTTQMVRVINARRRGDFAETGCSRQAEVDVKRQKRVKIEKLGRRDFAATMIKPLKRGGGVRSMHVLINDARLELLADDVVAQAVDVIVNAAHSRFAFLRNQQIFTVQNA